MAPSFDDITVTIVAKNAAATIGRAVRSALEAGAARILLVDSDADGASSTAATGEAPNHVRVVQAGTGTTLGQARAVALRHIETPFGIWLDADDRMAPGHLALMRAPLADGRADLVLSGAALVDGASGKAVRRLDMPDFMQAPMAKWRSFARNWYPVLVSAFDAGFARRVDYDPDFACAEDYDFLLRAIAAGARIEPLAGNSYHYYHYSGSVSRARGTTATHTARALAKHGNATLNRQLKAAGFDAVDRHGVLASKALFEGDWAAAARYATGLLVCDDISVEYGVPVSAVGRHYLGVAALKSGDCKTAIDHLNTVARGQAAAEAANNLAVALGMGGDADAAKTHLQAALAAKPGYADALANLAALEAGHMPDAVTLHPFRRAPSRDTYEG